MKLIVTIPAYNEEANIAEVIAEVPRSIIGIASVEVLVVDDGSTDGTVEVARAAGADYVISHGRNQGLAAAFRTALREALRRGADIIVNTDADNHYDQSRIPDLMQPLLRNEAEIVVGNRVLTGLRMRPVNKYGNRLANFIMQRLLRMPDVDVSSGFRAYTKEAAFKLNVLFNHTYTHETLVHALDQGMRVVSVPLPARHVDRPSRLIRSVPSHVWRASKVILSSFTLYRPLQVWGALGMLFALLGSIPFFRFLYFFAQGEGDGHIQSLVAGSALLFLGAQTLIAGMLASAIGWNRRLIEDVLYRQKVDESRRDTVSRAMATNGTDSRSTVGDVAGREAHVA